MKTHTRVAIVGGGIMGISLAYHLAEEGWNDVVVIEKGELTSGSTWHAAGLIPHFIGNLSMAQIHAESIKLYTQLEKETKAMGWHGCGSLRLALSEEEVNWFKYVQGISKYVGFEMHLLGPDQINEVHPLITTDGVLMGAWIPHDGHTDPTSTTNVLAQRARSKGVEIYRHTRVTDIQRQNPGQSLGEWKVVTENGDITAEHVVNAAGCYGPQVGAMVGVDVPSINMLHQYIVTDSIGEVAALDKELPVLRDPYSSCYTRQENDGIIIGPYETKDSQAWALDGVSWDFDMELLPPELDRISEHLEQAMERFPCSAEAGIKRIINGPITHTPDGNFLLGPAPNLRNFWMCCAASIGITQGGGCGKYLAQWMVHGQTEINSRAFDPRRFGSSYATQTYSLAKALDEYEHMYSVAVPGEVRDAGRPARVSPLYETLKAKGAQYTEAYGWERPQWFSTNGETEQYSYRRNNTFDAVAKECHAVRHGVGVMDFSSFAKFDVSGPDAHAFLNRLCANKVPRNGGITLTHMLTPQGFIESEFTISHIGDNHFYLLSGAAAEQHDLDLMRQSKQPLEQVEITNVTDDFGMLAVAGPKSRLVLSEVCDTDLSNENWPWFRAKTINVAGIECRVLRISYVGELGYEVHAPLAELDKIYHALMQSGEPHQIADFGVYAVNSLRMEKAYKGWGSELTEEITMIEADMERFVDYSKEDFVGKSALLERKNSDITMKLVYLDVDATDADVIGNEPVYDGDEIIGICTSGGYGHHSGQSLAFAYVSPTYANAGTQFSIEILGERKTATVLAEPVYDAQNKKIRG